MSKLSGSMRLCRSAALSQVARPYDSFPSVAQRFKRLSGTPSTQTQRHTHLAPSATASERAFAPHRALLRHRGCIMRTALMKTRGHDRWDGALAMTERAFALKQPYSTIVVNLAVWPFCQNRALPLRGGDFGMPDGACVRLDGSDASTVLRAPRGVVYILRSVPTVTYDMKRVSHFDYHG